MTFLLIVLVAVAGGYVAEFEGVVFGALLGFLLARILLLQNRVTQLENRPANSAPEWKSPATTSAEPAADLSTRTRSSELAPGPTPESRPAPRAKPARAYTIAETLARQAGEKATPPRAPSSRKVFTLNTGKLGEFLMRGNPIVKIAVIVLFFGVAFLFKYAADKNLFPIEWRLISISIAATTMLLWGLKLRNSQRLYALVIQGGALGILYLTVFASAKFYALVPLPAALIIMVLLVFLSGFLAIWQDSKSLAVFSTIGGFLAPALTATDTGNHVQLFSYYAVLNLGILGVSWFKAWRLLIWLGFVFTFLIGTAWGFFDYRDALFSTTEPFLVFFFLLYVIIPVWYLRKQTGEQKGVLDSSVIFGLPAISFMMQYVLVEDRFLHGDAWSALAWGLVYLAAAGTIRWRKLPHSETLRLSYIAIGWTFLTVTVFFAFSKDVTSVFWALEGIGLVWLGCRQKQILPRIAGTVLQILAVIIFAEHYAKIPGSTILLNTQHLVLVCISLAILANAYVLDRFRAKTLPFESWLGS